MSNKNKLAEYYYKVLLYFLKRKNPLLHAKKIGVNIDSSVRIIGRVGWGSEPWLITVGKRTLFSDNVSLITHDGGVSVAQKEGRYKNVMKFGRIDIGEDCFIGARSVILPDVIIGDRCVIGACSLVTKDVPSGEVWGGNPARFICTTEDYSRRLLENMPKEMPWDISDKKAISIFLANERRSARMNKKRM